MVIPLIVVPSLPSLARFGYHWSVGKDAIRYLFAGSELISGQGLHTPGGAPFNGGHGPGFPAVIGALILVFGRDLGSLAWAVRLLTLLNPLLAYFLVRRISGRLAGLIAAALLTLFGSINRTFNIDTVFLVFCLSALLALLGAIWRNSSGLALLSGGLLGVSILTKESGVVNAPLALLAVLLLGWDVRGALWHYLGLALVCLPWWVWDYSATGELYLIDRLPPSLQLPFLVAFAAFLAIGTLAYTTCAVDKYLAGERRRRWTGWFVVLAWTVSLTGLALFAGAPALAKASSKSLSMYLADLLAPAIAVVPVLILISGYALWKATWRDGEWTLLALALLLQMPVCLLVVVEEWAPRQYLVFEALVFCALAAPLVILLLIASVERVQACFPRTWLAGHPSHTRCRPRRPGWSIG